MTEKSLHKLRVMAGAALLAIPPLTVVAVGSPGTTSGYSATSGGETQPGVFVGPHPLSVPIKAGEIQAFVSKVTDQAMTSRPNAACWSSSITRVNPSSEIQTYDGGAIGLAPADPLATKGTWQTMRVTVDRDLTSVPINDSSPLRTVKDGPSFSQKQTSQTDNVVVVDKSGKWWIDANDTEQDSPREERKIVFSRQNNNWTVTEYFSSKFGSTQAKSPAVNLSPILSTDPAITGLPSGTASPGVEEQVLEAARQIVDDYDATSVSKLGDCIDPAIVG